MEFLLFLIITIAFIILVAKISTITSKLDDAILEIKMLQGRVHQLESPDPSPATAEPSPPAHLPATAPPRVGPAPIPPPAPVSHPVPAPVFAPPPPPKPSKTKEEWEALIGGKLLNRIGALALIIGVGFFLKYAFDRNWINEWMRVLIGVATGTVLLLGAARSHKRGLAIFSQGLVGAGIAILYLSVYASFNYYSLVSQPIAFGMMGVVTVVAFLQAFRYDSLAVSLLGWLGGFLTPILLSTGEVNATGLFTYLALLDAGMLAVLLLKPHWTILEPLSLGATYVFYYLWHADYYGEQFLPVAVFFLAVFWLLFQGLDTARAMLTQEKSALLHRLVSGVNATAFSIGMYLVIDPGHHLWMGSVGALIAALYAVSAIAIARKRHDRTTEVMHMALTAIVLAVLAAEIHFEDFIVIPVYALEAAALAWIGVRRDLRYVWVAALGVLGWAVLVLLVTRGSMFWPEPSTFTFLWNKRAAAFAALIASSVLFILIMRRAPRGMVPQLIPILHSTWIFLGFLLLTAEISDLFRSYIEAAPENASTLAFHRGLVMAASWACYAIPLTWAGESLDLRPIRASGIIVLVFASLLALFSGSRYVPLEGFMPILNPRCAMLLFVGGTGLWQARWLRRKDRFTFGSWVHVPWMVIWFLGCTVETLDTFRHIALTTPADGQEELAFLKLMMLAALWLAGALPLVFAGARSGDRVIYAGGLLMGALGCMLTDVRGFEYYPLTTLVSLVNPRVAVLLGATLALALAIILTRGSRPPHPWTEEIILTLRLLIIATTLVLITGEIRDYFNREIALLHNAEAPETHDLANLQQMLLSSAWLLYSILLMGYGLWRRTRALRIAAIVLFGVAILKIFIYDLSFLDTVYRIVSFIGLGIILLAVSYLYQRYRALIFDSNS